MGEDILDRYREHIAGVTMSEERMPTLLDDMAVEIERLREKNRDLNRRCQLAESAVAEKVAKYPHRSLGRALANSAAEMYRAQAEDAATEIASLRARLEEAEKDRAAVDALREAAKAIADWYLVETQNEAAQDIKRLRAALARLESGEGEHG